MLPAAAADRSHPGMTQARPIVDVAMPVAGQPLRLGLIYNSRSGHHRRRWGKPQMPADVPAIEANNPEEIRDALERLAGLGVELLAVAGGDGTVGAVLSELLVNRLFARPPLLALLPTGSTNMTGKDVGLVRVRRRGWQRLCAWAADPRDIAERVHLRPVLKIQPGAGRPAFCGMFFGAGAIYYAVQHTLNKLHDLGLRGDVGPAVTFVRFFNAVTRGDRRFFAPVHVRLKDAAGYQETEDKLLLLASTLNRLLLRLQPFWGNEGAPLRWTAVADDAQSLLRKLPAVCRGNGARLAPEQGYRSHNTSRLELHFDGGYVVDGELFEARAAEGPVVLSSAGEAAFLNL